MRRPVAHESTPALSLVTTAVPRTPVYYRRTARRNKPRTRTTRSATRTRTPDTQSVCARGSAGWPLPSRSKNSTFPHINLNPLLLPLPAGNRTWHMCLPAFPRVPCTPLRCPLALQRARAKAPPHIPLTKCKSHRRGRGTEQRGRVTVRHETEACTGYSAGTGLTNARTGAFRSSCLPAPLAQSTRSSGYRSSAPGRWHWGRRASSAPAGELALSASARCAQPTRRNPSRGSQAAGRSRAAARGRVLYH